MTFNRTDWHDMDDLDFLGDWEAPETGFDGGDDPLDEAPFTAEELLRLAAELLPESAAGGEQEVENGRIKRDGAGLAAYPAGWTGPGRAGG